MRFRKLIGATAAAVVASAGAVSGLAAPAQAAAAPQTVTKEFKCSYTTFHMYFDAQLAVSVDGTKVTATMNDFKSTALPAALSISGSTATADLTIDGEKVSLTAAPQTFPAQAGTAAVKFGEFAGTRTGSGTGNVSAMDTLGLTLTAQYGSFGAPAATKIDCVPYAPTTTTDAAVKLTCAYTTYAMPYAVSVSATYDRKNGTAQLSPVKFEGLPATFKINSIAAKFTAGAKTSTSASAVPAPVAFSSPKNTFTPSLLATEAAAILPATGTTTDVLFPLNTVVQAVEFAVNLTPAPFVDRAMDATIKCGIPNATTTKLTATHPAPGKVALAAVVDKAAAAGKVQIFEGTTKVGAATTVTAGVANLSVENVTGGSHSYTAVFTPTALDEFTGSTSTAATVVVVTQPCVDTKAALAGAQGGLASANAAVTAATAAVKAATTKVSSTKKAYTKASKAEAKAKKAAKKAAKKKASKAKKAKAKKAHTKAKKAKAKAKKAQTKAASQLKSAKAQLASANAGAATAAAAVTAAQAVVAKNC